MIIKVQSIDGKIVEINTIRAVLKEIVYKPSYDSRYFIHELTDSDLTGVFGIEKSVEIPLVTYMMIKDKFPDIKSYREDLIVTVKGK